MKKAIDIACGKDKVKIDGAEVIGIDHYPFEGVDVCRDLMRGLPFSDNTFDMAIAKHILEHFIGFDLVFLIDEIWRVMKPDAEFLVVVPDQTSPNIWTDPTHLTRDWNTDSFRFWYVASNKKHIIFRGPAYRSEAKLHLMETSINSNKDRTYRLRIIK